MQLDPLFLRKVLSINLDLDSHWRTVFISRSFFPSLLWLIEIPAIFMQLPLMNSHIKALSPPRSSSSLHMLLPNSADTNSLLHQQGFHLLNSATVEPPSQFTWVPGK